MIAAVLIAAVVAAVAAAVVGGRQREDEREDWADSAAMTAHAREQVLPCDVNKNTRRRW